MFKQRFATASVLALVFISALLFLTTPVFISLMMLVILIAGWEWADLARIRSILGKLLFVLALLLCMLAIANYVGIFTELDYSLSYQICFAQWYCGL